MLQLAALAATAGHGAEVLGLARRASPARAAGRAARQAEHLQGYGKQALGAQMHEHICVHRCAAQAETRKSVNNTDTNHNREGLDPLHAFSLVGRGSSEGV